MKGSTKRGILFSAILSCLAILLGMPAYSATEILFGHLEQVESPVGQGALEFKKALEEKTGGEIKVKIYPAMQIGDAQQMVEQSSSGQIQMHAAGFSGNKKFDYVALPYLFRNWDHFDEVVMGEVGATWRETWIKEKGIRLLGILRRGPRHLTTTDVAVKTPEDCKGLKLRAPQIAIFIETWKALGARPEPLPFGEVYMALRTGLLKGQENPIELIMTSNFNEVQKYLILTGHTLLPHWIGMNEKFYQGLSEKHKKALQESIQTGIKKSNELLELSEAKMIESLKSKGMVVITPDIPEFRKATEGVAKIVKVDEAWGQGVYEKIKASK